MKGYENDDQSKKVYINLCSHPKIECVKDMGGNEVKGIVSTYDGFQIPMLVSPLRTFRFELKKKCLDLLSS